MKFFLKGKLVHGELIPISEVLKQVIPRCPKCRSQNVVKNGLRKGRIVKQKFRCNDCGRKFVENPHTPKAVVDFALRQVSLGESLRTVANLIQEKYGIKRSHVAIGKWTNQPKTLRRSVPCARRCPFNVEGYCQLRHPPLIEVYGGVYLCQQAL